jgi:hypothetical protein
MLRGLLVLSACIFMTAGALAEPKVVASEGFGDTASSAITNAAVNAVRDVAGSRITVEQNLTTEMVNGVPDERFLEELLEVSRGSIEHLQIISVEQVGEIFKASVQVAVDPGLLELEQSNAGAITLQPGAFAGDVATATMQVAGRQQLQNALREFMDPRSKTVTIKSVTVEDDETALYNLRNNGLLQGDTIPMRIAVEIAASETSYSELINTLLASAEEAKPRENSSYFFSCEHLPNSGRATHSVGVFEPNVSPLTSGTVSCGAMSTDFRSDVTGAVRSVFNFDFDLTVSNASSHSVFDIMLTGETKQTISLSIDPQASLPAMINNAYVDIARTDGTSTHPGFSDRGLFDDKLFNPSALTATQYREDPNMWIVYERLVISFTVPLPASSVEGLSEVAVQVSRQ